VRVEIPTRLTAEQSAALVEFARLLGEAPRTHRSGPARRKPLFGKHRSADS
jgi:hypothetical protein